MKKIIIVAVAENGIIGNNGEMPWHSREEFKHFKNTTMGHVLIMGRKTFESLGKPLKGRTTIVITRDTDLKYDFDNVVVLNNLNDSFQYCEDNNFEKCFICGGGEIYRQSMEITDQIIISIMKINPDGDTKFPEINEENWIVEKTEDHEEFKIYWYKRKVEE